ncbi:MAG: thymidylate synthase [Candidatus Nomurabacteria bacterium]|nr:thymidylate synthase [Candidatus Nomurabacteria bacterium]USN88214.1 MAG: thymidylate synthase [Candidatus Nomurabacteria bacterium]
MSNKHPEYQYLDLMQELLEKGDRQEDLMTGDVTHSLFGRQLRFDLSEGLPLLTTKKVYWKGVLHELYWFMSGQTNIKYLVDNNVHIWDDYPFRIYNNKREKEGWPEMTKEEFIEKIATDDEYATKHGELPRIYGEMWRKWPTKDGRGIDQLQWVVDEIKKDPHAHNTLVNSWNPEYLYSMAKPSEASQFPICHNMYQVNIKNGRLCLQLYQRSADIFLGVPFNIASYSLLTMLLAKITGYEPGEFIHTFGDVHIYENHKEQAKEQMSREPMKFPTVILSDEMTSLDDFRPEHVTLNNYESHPPIKAQMAVVGGVDHKIEGD